MNRIDCKHQPSINFDFASIKMESQLPLSEIMPLFSPVYNPKGYATSSQLKQRMREGNFDEKTKSIAESLLLNQPSNYNWWYCKKMHLRSNPNPDIQQEYAFANNCLGEKAKSFQVWQQKRLLIDYHKDPEREMEHSARILREVDHKNYHAWSFRTGLVDARQDWENEMAFANQMIAEDSFNNSAWTYRFFLVSRMAERANEEDRKKLMGHEIEFTLGEIEKEKSNRASWNYLRGLFPSIKLNQFSSRNALRAPLISSFQVFPSVLQHCLKWWEEQKEQAEKESKEKAMKSRMAQREILCTLVHIHSQTEDGKEYAKNICQQLAEKEKQRQFYWKWVQNNL